MRRTLMVCVVFLAAARTAAAQTRVYVSGDLFAEMPKFSRQSVSPDEFGTSDIVPLDSTTAGGGARVGAFLSPEWSVELGVDIGRTISDTRTKTVSGPLGVTPVPAPQQFQELTTSRFSTTSVLLGYHPPARGRVHPGFGGGVSFIHKTASYTSPGISTSTTFLASPVGIVPVTVLSLITHQYSSIGNGLTATLGAEAAIAWSDHFAVVPEIRAHAGGIGAILIRPGVAARWRW